MLPTAITAGAEVCARRSCPRTWATLGRRVRRERPIDSPGTAPTDREGAPVRANCLRNQALVTPDLAPVTLQAAVLAEDCPDRGAQRTASPPEEVLNGVDGTDPR